MLLFVFQYNDNCYCADDYDQAAMHGQCYVCNGYDAMLCAVQIYMYDVIYAGAGEWGHCVLFV